MRSSEWREVKLGEAAIEIIDGDRGKNYPNGSDFSNKGYCLFLNAKNVTSAGFAFDETQFITKEKDELLRKGKLIRKDIVMTTRGTVGNVAYYKHDIPYEYMRINSGMVILRCDESKIYPKYGYWLLKSPIIQDQILAIRTGSAQPQLPISIMRNLEFLLPSIKEQKAIADTLSCLDDKIELNNKINKTLEEVAQAIFKSWFVDFEPFKDGEFEDSELGRIPKGWRVGTLGDIASITMGQSPKGSSYNENNDGTVFYQGRTDFGKRFPTIRLYTTEAKRMAHRGDILLSVRAPVGDINVAIEDCCIGRGLASLRSKNECNSYLLYQLINLKDGFNVYNGEGTVFGSINKDTLNDIRVIIPPNDIIQKFQNSYGRFDVMFENNSIQIRTLTAIRDSLLPELMSGKIRVPIEEVE
ncbi:restriction endonuclease subunit S [Metallumcola ferriviriculae]|uniref:Restriction endonuclease subunit S n=1 Tax=Metallumcola ferriviriculae TaxID=3039180 RepID=A0AAU0UM89_9FIRM|nr:restriction endonuclease subunit S [Desulfitibacteraceae bacterium MK1]